MRACLKFGSFANKNSKLDLIFDNEDGTFKKKLMCALEAYKSSRVRALGYFNRMVLIRLVKFAVLLVSRVPLLRVPRNSIQLLHIN